MRSRPLFCLLLVGCATSPQTGDAPPPEEDLPAESFDIIATLASYLSGEFDSYQQSIDDPRYFAIQLTTCAVSAPELGETVLYVEQASMDTPADPYRQRLYAVLADEGSDVAHTEVYALDDAAAAVGLCGDDEAATFTADDVSLREGCGVDVTWHETSAAFTGGTEGTDCSSDLGDAHYATSEVTVSADLLESWDRGWAAAGNQAWGAEAGPYRFVRRAEEKEEP